MSVVARMSPSTAVGFLALGGIAMSALAERASAQQERVTVRASRREVIATFPRDSSGRWGWPASGEAQYSARYGWLVLADGMDGPHSLYLYVWDTTKAARRFASLARLVAAGRTEICRPGVFSQCRARGTAARVRDGQVVLALTDSAEIARLFGMRPRFVRVWQYGPGRRTLDDSAAVEYVEPQIAEPDSATRAEVARARRRYTESTRLVTRRIVLQGTFSGSGAATPIWLQLSDSATLHISEMRCVYDACTSEPVALADSGWTVSDAAVARLDTFDTPRVSATLDSLRRAMRWLIALSPGRARLTIRGLHGASDTAASHPPPERELMRDIVVTRRVTRIEITPRPDTVHVGEPFTLAVRVVDDAGEVVSGLPVVLDYGNEHVSRSDDAGAPVTLTLRAAGRTRITASLGQHRDTVMVTVVPPAGRRRDEKPR